MVCCTVQSEIPKEAVIVKEEDAPRINRIVDRFQFASVTEAAKIKTEIERTRAEKAKAGKSEKQEKKPEKGPDIDLIYRQVEDKLKSIMGTKVVINQKDKNKGRIEIEYYSQEELERLIELMESLRA